MPTAPPCLTLKPFSTRPGPRWQATILPENNPAGAGERHCGSLYGGADENTTAAGPAPAVIDAPLNVAVAPPGPVRLRVDSNDRPWVEAATVVTHGDRWSAVAAPGPEFPAEAATNTPAAYASRNASSTASLNG